MMGLKVRSKGSRISASESCYVILAMLGTITSVYTLLSQKQQCVVILLKCLKNNVVIRYTNVGVT